MFSYCSASNIPYKCLFSGRLYKLIPHLPLVPFFQCGIVSMSYVSFFSQVSAVWPLYISSTTLCVISCSFLHCLPPLLPSPYIFCSHQQYLLLNHCLHRGAVLELLSEQTSAGFAASFSRLWFSICHHPATMGQSLLVHLVIYVSLLSITTFSSQQMHLILASASRAVWAEWVQGPGAGRTLPMLLEREK